MTDQSFNVRVAAVARETPEILAFELERVDGEPLPAFTPGAHVDLHLAPGVVRQYSLCNGPGASTRYQIAVKREPESRGGSARLHDQVKPGDVLKLTGPRNHFPLVESATEHLLLAGGIGVTPLLSMARHLKAAGRPFHLKYFARSPQMVAFRPELSGPDCAEAVEFQYALDPDRLRTYLHTLLAHPPEGAHVYVCGPRPFMDLAVEIATVTYPKGHVHMEYFGADPMAQAGPRGSFRVRCARSERELEVGAEESIVNVLSRNGVHVEIMCEQGVCGTCLTGVLGGRPDHRDSYLTDDEKAANDRMMVCCSRSFDDVLVLDI